MRLLIVGNRGGTNVGESFERAAHSLGHEVTVLEIRRAMDAPAWVRRLSWHVFGHRPPRLKTFSEEVLHTCVEWRPDVLLATGIAPLTQSALSRLRGTGLKIVNFLTDDPWNPAHRAGWFLRALPEYGWVFSPRKANLDDLRLAGCRQVCYLPFAFDPNLHYVQAPPPEVADQFKVDVLFIGGADRDRIPFCQATLQSGFRLALYGDYWRRFGMPKSNCLGYADLQTIRMATGAAKISLCLVRRANRDGHVMRSFEIPAMGGCMLAEDTTEHRELFGDDGEAVLYFKTPSEMVARARWLLEHDAERKRLATTAHLRITNGKNTYRDRLEAILKTVAGDFFSGACPATDAACSV